MRDGLISDVILSLAAAPNGDLWVGTPDGLNRIRRGAVDAFTSADGLPDDFIRSLLADADGSLWIGTRRGLTHWTGAAGRPARTWRPIPRPTGLGSDLVGAMARDTQRRPVGSDLGRPLAARERQDHQLHHRQRPFEQRDHRAAAARERNAADRHTGPRLEPVGRASDSPRRGTTASSQTTIHAILDDGGGSPVVCDRQRDCALRLRSMGDRGRLHALDRVRRSRRAAQPGDGHQQPSLGLALRDGHLWFATPKGLVEVDPAHFPVNTVPAAGGLERFAVDDVAQPLTRRTASIEIPAGHVHFEFDYAGLSFIAPQKVRYRYMLEGFDKRLDRGRSAPHRLLHQHSAGPLHLSRAGGQQRRPVEHRRRGLAFELRPHFYQTVWFYLLLLAARRGLVVLLLRRRLLVAQREFSAVLGERNRIAREIHDTLAQGYVGISVQLEVLAELLRHSKVEAAAKHLDTTRGYVREGLADARQSIWALRSQDSGETTLPVRMRRMVEAEGGHGMEVEVQHLWRIPAVAAGHRARNAARGPGSHP